MNYPTFTTGKEGFMRKDDHQFFQPLFISDFGPLERRPAVRRGEYRLGLEAGRAMIPAKDTIVPTTCKMKRPE